MERESFESEETAKLLNKYFVSIKASSHQQSSSLCALAWQAYCWTIFPCLAGLGTTSRAGVLQVDREERPDVDRVYMTFVQVAHRHSLARVIGLGSMNLCSPAPECCVAVPIQACLLWVEAASRTLLQIQGVGPLALF